MLHENDPIEHCLALTFDILGWRALEIRIRPQAEYSSQTT
jgi:hypothetical protein